MEEAELKRGRRKHAVREPEPEPVGRDPPPAARARI